MIRCTPNNRFNMTCYTTLLDSRHENFAKRFIFISRFDIKEFFPRLPNSYIVPLARVHRRRQCGLRHSVSFMRKSHQF